MGGKTWEFNHRALEDAEEGEGREKHGSPQWLALREDKRNQHKPFLQLDLAGPNAGRMCRMALRLARPGLQVGLTPPLRSAAADCPRRSSPRSRSRKPSLLSTSSPRRRHSALAFSRSVSRLS